MGLIIGLIVFAIAIAIGSAVSFGVSLAIVYGLMWLLHDVLSLPYAAASSTAFVLFLFGVVFYAIGVFAKSENKGVGLILAVYVLLVMPIMYAAAFNAHRIWTHTTVVGDGRYLPGEYWSVVTNYASLAAAKISDVVPAMSGVFSAISNNALLTGIVASAFSTLVLQPMAQKMFKNQAGVG
ncbi:MAG TPA: hypothetical protein VG841_05490 [Caulobacterales bacterium]|nr:hypothetical protein [Caulobacterales bacterium]